MEFQDSRSDSESAKISKKELTPEQKQRKAEYAREWRKRNPEKVKEHSRRTRQKNKDKIRARQEKWRKENKEYLREKGRQYYQEHKQRVKHMALLRQFGITLEEYESRLDAQEGRCAICQSDSPGSKDSFAVDHDHDTGEVRGLLCSNCNVGLGHFRDDIGLLQDAISYLRNFQSKPLFREDV